MKDCSDCRWFDPATEYKDEHSQHRWGKCYNPKHERFCGTYASVMRDSAADYMCGPRLKNFEPKPWSPPARTFKKVRLGWLPRYWEVRVPYWDFDSRPAPPMFCWMEEEV